MRTTGNMNSPKRFASKAILTLAAVATIGFSAIFATAQVNMTAQIPILFQTQTPSTPGAIYQQAAPSVVSIEAYNDKGQVGWTGTGFIVAADGKILTNYHVIRNSKQATVRLANGDAFDAVEVMDVDSRKDIAFLKIKAIDLKVLRVGSSSTAQVGDTVYSLSNPLGLPRTLSQGIISGIRQLDGYQLLQITAPISPGSSGGPLFNTKGEVIGITAAALEGGQSLNFAIPIDYARGMILSPSDPRPPASVYNPERPAGPVDGPVDANPSPDAGRELRRNALAFLKARLGTWTTDDARKAMGTPLDHRSAYDTDNTNLGEIYAFKDPSGLFQEIELVFSPKTRRMFYIYAYPSNMTWDDCKKVWGDDVKVFKYSNGTRRHQYSSIQVDVTLDKRNNVISLGFY